MTDFTTTVIFISAGATGLLIYAIYLLMKRRRH